MSRDESLTESGSREERGFQGLPQLKVAATRTAVIRVLITALVPVSISAAMAFGGAAIDGREWTRSSALLAGHEVQSILGRVELDLERHARSLEANLVPVLPPSDVVVVQDPAGRRLISGSPAAEDAARRFLDSGATPPRDGCQFVNGPPFTLVCAQPARGDLAALVLLCLPPPTFADGLQDSLGTEFAVSMGGEPVISSWRNMEGDAVMPGRDTPWTPAKASDDVASTRGLGKYQIEGGYQGFRFDDSVGAAGAAEVHVFEGQWPLRGSDGSVNAWLHAASPAIIHLRGPLIGLVAAFAITLLLALVQIPVLNREIAAILDPVTNASDEIHRMAIALSHMSEAAGVLSDDSEAEPPSLTRETAPPRRASRETAMLLSASRRLDAEVRKAQSVSRWRDAMEQRLRAATENAQASNRAKSEFLANISHELRTPLTLIIGHTELLIEETEGELAAVERREDLHQIRRAGLQLLSLINDLLDVAKIEAGALEVRPEPFLLGSLLGAVVESFRPVAAAEGNSIELHAGPGLPALLGDPVRIEQVVTNLVSNALKFTRAGQIHVRASQGSTGVVLEVEDTGIGMNPAEQSTVFSAFVQGDMSSTRRAGGTGLGLTITEKLVRAMGGTIELRSSPGEGTVFRVRLPLEVARDEDSRALTTDEYARRSDGRHLALRR